MTMTISDDTEHELRGALTEIVRQNGQTAVILQHINDRIEAIEKRHEQEDEDKRTAGQRSWQHREALPMTIRDWLVLIVAVAAFLASALPHIHWMP